MSVVPPGDGGCLGGGGVSPDVFLSPPPQLNRDLYEVMSKLEKQHSSKVFIIKGVPR